MNLKTLIAAAVAAAFALPLAAQASVDSDTIILAQGGPAGSSSVGTGPTGGTPTPQTAGEPKAAAGAGARGDATVVTPRADRCLGMTGMERDNCMRDDRAARDAAVGGGASSSVGTSSGGATTGTTAGPGEASPKTAPSSDTATSPSTSGTGKAK
jgi:hypothetical protein